MRSDVRLGPLCLVTVASLAVGCTSPGSTTTTKPVGTETYATAAASPTPDIEITVCARFDRFVFPGIAATLHNAVGKGTPNPPYRPAQAKLLRDDLKLSHWSSLVESQANDSTFAGYLLEAGAMLGVVGGPYSTALQAETAASDIGHVNGYCKYDAS
jgi:hypothetical protein